MTGNQAEGCSYHQGGCCSCVVSRAVLVKHRCETPVQPNGDTASYAGKVPLKPGPLPWVLTRLPPLQTLARGLLGTARLLAACSFGTACG